MELKHRVIIAFLFLVLVVSLGTLGYHFIFGWDLLDALYMTVITITTVGFREVQPLTRPGQLFTIAVTIFGVGGALYTFSTVTEVIVEGHLRNLFRRNRMEKKAATMSGHVIICGYGRMGRIVVDELKTKKVPFVVIESDPAATSQIIEAGELVIEGDATSDDVLKKAGIENARAIACVVDSDANNLYITLSARVLNRNVFILARANEEAAEEKLRRAGANKVIFPYRIGARQIAEMIVHPNVMEFLDMVFEKDSLQLQLQELTVPAGSFLAGVTLRHSGLRERYNIIVAGIRKRGSGQMLFNPPTDSTLDTDDILILIGEPEKMEQMATDLGR